MQHGETPGYPRFQGAGRSISGTYSQYGGGAVLDGGILSRSQLGRVCIRVHRPLSGTPQTVTLSQEADGWYACFSCAEVPSQPLPLTGKETGIDVGLTAFLVTAGGGPAPPPAPSGAGTQESRPPRQPPPDAAPSPPDKKAVALRAEQQRQKVQRQRHDRDDRDDHHHKTALRLVRGCGYAVISRDDLRVATLVRNRHPATSIADAEW
jgi:putative transposase